MSQEKRLLRFIQADRTYRLYRILRSYGLVAIVLVVPVVSAGQDGPGIPIASNETENRVIIANATIEQSHSAYRWLSNRNNTHNRYSELVLYNWHKAYEAVNQDHQLSAYRAYRDKYQHNPVNSHNLILSAQSK